MLIEFYTAFTIFLHVAIAFGPYERRNETTNGTILNGTSPCSALTAAAAVTLPPPPPPRPSGPPCLGTFYPSELRIMNSRYASFDDTELHTRTNMFMALRQREDTFMVATQVQFNDVVAPNWTACHLKFDIPGNGMQKYSGSQPILFVYQVRREAGSVANWDTYEPANVTANPPVYGQINGTSDEQNIARQYYQSYYDVGSGPCNRTMTFQIGMAFNGVEDVNHWEFINTAPPLIPSQGFKLWAGNTWCVGQ